MKDKLRVKELTIFLILTTIVVITLGGTIRIYDAGESCPDWPKCFGTWGFDISESEQGIWYDENPDEIDSRGVWHRYSTFEIFTEWIHRFLAGMVLGPLVIVNWFLARRQYGKDKSIKSATTISLILIVWQGAVGMLTVKMDNEHWSVILHLGSALIFTLSLIWTWMILSIRERESWFYFGSEISIIWKKRVLFACVLTLLTLFSGTLVSTSPGANNGCGIGGFFQSWPLCDGKIFSRITNVVAQSQMIHRWIVALVGIILLRYSYLLMHENDSKLKKWIHVSTLLYVINILLGGLYILSWTQENYFIETLSLIHLILASSTFLLIATAYMGISIVEIVEDNNRVIPED